MSSSWMSMAYSTTPTASAYPTRASIHQAHLARQCVEKNDLKIVVSSTWRFHPHALRTALSWCGWDDPPIIGATDRDGNNRGEQIKRWVQEYKPTSYVILDDIDSTMQPVIGRLVKTDPEVGLTAYDVRTALRLLEMPT